MEILFLDQNDVREVLRMDRVIEAVETAFKEKGMGRVQMPPKTYLDLGKGDLRTMPSFLEERGVAAVKVVNVHPGNRERGIPTVMGTVLLIDPDTGATRAIMDGTWLTAMRTGAAGGVAAKHLARRDSETVGLIGAGVQARTQLMALREVLPGLREARVHDLFPEVRERFVREMSASLGVDVLPVEGPEEAVRGADIVVTATPSRQPVVRSEWVEDGVHINSIGADAPGKRELFPELVMRAKVVVDDWEQASHSGEINVLCSQGAFCREDVHAEIGEIVAGMRRGREDDGEVTLFNSTGLAIQDAMAADLVYREAVERRLGRELLL